MYDSQCIYEGTIKNTHTCFHEVRLCKTSDSMFQPFAIVKLKLNLRWHDLLSVLFRWYRSLHTQMHVTSYGVDTVVVTLYYTELQLTMAWPSVCVIQMIPVTTHTDVPSMVLMQSWSQYITLTTTYDGRTFCLCYSDESRHYTRRCTLLWCWCSRGHMILHWTTTYDGRNVFLCHSDNTP